MDYSKLEPNNILGLDLSLSSTGYHRIGTPASGNIDTESLKLGGFERLEFIISRVMELVSEGDLVVIENNAFNALGSAKSKLAELNGLVKYFLWKRGIQFVLVAPTTLKKFILGGGKGTDKSLIIKEVLKQYTVDAMTDDEADATVLAHIGCCLVGLEEARNKPQREVLVTLTAEKKPKKRKKKQVMDEAA